MERIELILPAHFGPYLINGDGSNISEHDAEDIDNFLHTRGVRIVSCLTEEPEFKNNNDFDNLWGNCHIFTAEKLVYAD